MSISSKRYIAAAAAIALAGGVTAAPALAVGVTVNGQAVTLNPPPIERAGRVFVPLRGVFGQLGASVVYANGVINATGNGSTISLKIGSTDATVNGVSRPLDVAPFIVGASTYVPLRFVSQALGAGVNFDGTNQIVALTTANAPTQYAPRSQPPQPSVGMVGHILRDEIPARNSTVGSVRPTIQAAFAQPVDANSVRLNLDGLDVTRDATRSESGFVYAPTSPLQSMRHTLVVTGKLSSGQPFSENYAFSSGTEPARNSLTITSPGEGQPLGREFDVTGHTAPNARVHIVAGASTNVGGYFSMGTGSYVGDTIADGQGNFSQTVSLQSYGGGAIGLTVTSTDPTTKESAEKKLQLRGQ
jgi:hypothetical protein